MTTEQPGNGKPNGHGEPDENERLKDGTINKDVRDGTHRVKGEEAPRVLTVPQILDASVERALQAKGRAFCTTGNHWVDAATGGMMPGDCWLFGADTSYGKSSWAIMLLDLNLRAGKRVLIVTSEDDESLYGDRLMCRRASLDAKRYRNGTLNAAEWGKIRDTQARAEPVPVYMDARPHVMEKLAPQLDKVIKEQAIDLIIFDYLQEFRSKQRWQDERIKYKEIAAMQRRVVKQNKKCGLILSQLTMTPGKKTPDKHNIRESRDVSNAAETILIGFIPEQDIKVDDTDDVQFHAGERVVLIDKCKKGPRGGRFEMPWDDRTASFIEVIEPEQARLNRLAAEEQYDDGDLGGFAEDGGRYGKDD
jgi:replicative DNA helicase